MGLLHHLMLRFNSEYGNSNEVERLQKMKPSLDAHWMPPMKKCKKVRDLVYSDRGIQAEEIAQE